MKRILLGLLTSLCVPTSFAECTYAFDAKQSQINQWNAKEGVNLSLFSQINLAEQKGIAEVESSKGGGQVMSSSRYMAASLNAPLLIRDQPFKDKSINGKNIAAYEIVVDFSDVKNAISTENQSNAILTHTYMVGASEQRTEFVAILDYLMAKNNLRFTDGYHTFIGLLEASEHEPQHIVNTVHVPFASDDKIRIGLYINQATRQMGYILNGVNYGYLNMIFTQPITQIGFQFVMDGAYNDTPNGNAIGKKVSFQLITDHSKLKFNYPTGTTDICGNAL